MKNALTTLILSSLTALASAQGADLTSFSAETYGNASGDTPMRGLGLVLELVDGDSAEPRLRLFGGPAGQSAAIVLSASAAEAPGPRDSVRLVEEGGITLNGAFDWRGYFEVALPPRALSVGNFHAQGVHVGIFDLAGPGMPLTQYSNGLHVFPTPVDEDPIAFDDLLPHLPERQEHLPATATLAERLQRYLNSPGDETKIKLHVEGGLAYFAGGGAQIEVEFVVARTEDNKYEVKIGADVAAKGGVELAEGLEANLKAGYGATTVFRFHSAHGAARGIMGLLLTSSLPDLTPGRWVAEQLLPEAQQAVQALELSIQLAQQHADEAEALLWDVLDLAAVEARSHRDHARSRLKNAVARLASARWRDRPYWAVQVSLRSNVYLAAEAAYQTCRIAREHGETALELAKAVIEENREELRKVLAAAARMNRIASAIALLNGYTNDHYFGTEVRGTTSLGAELGIPIPVKVAFLGAGVEREVEVQVSVMFEGLLGEGAKRITVKRQLQDKFAAHAAAFVGGEFERKHTGALVETFELEDGEFHKTTSVSLERDVLVGAQVGAGATGGVVFGTGIGRKSSLSMERDFSIDPDFELVPFLLGDGRDRLGETEVGVSLQDRVVRTIEHDLIISVAGNGGGWELDIEWTDQGRLLSRSKTIREAIEDVFDGPTQIPDEESGTVVTP